MSDGSFVPMTFGQPATITAHSPIPLSQPLSTAMSESTRLIKMQQAQQTLDANSVKLSNGEYVDKGKFSLLSSADQSRLMRDGINKFNADNQAAYDKALAAQQSAQQKINIERQQFQASNVKLSTGEYVPKDKFNALSVADKSLLMNLGVAQFNLKKESEYKAAVQAQKQAQQQFEASNVKLNNGEYIDRAKFNALSPADQKLLMNVGLDKFNTQKNTEYQASLKEQQAFEANNIKLSNGEYTDKVKFNALSPSDQARLMRDGITKFNEDNFNKYNAEVEKYVQEASQDEFTQYMGATPAQLRALGITEPEVIAKIQPKPVALNLPTAYPQGTLTSTQQVIPANATVEQLRNLGYSDMQIAKIQVQQGNIQFNPAASIPLPAFNATSQDWTNYFDKVATIEKANNMASSPIPTPIAEQLLRFSSAINQAQQPVKDFMRNVMGMDLPTSDEFEQYFRNLEKSNPNWNKVGNVEVPEPIARAAYGLVSGVKDSLRMTGVETTPPPDIAIKGVNSPEYQQWVALQIGKGVAIAASFFTGTGAAGVIGKIGTVAVPIAFGADTAVNWNKMNATEQGISVAFVALTAIPAIRMVKTTLSGITGKVGVDVASKLENTMINTRYKMYNDVGSVAGKQLANDMKSASERLATAIDSGKKSQMKVAGTDLVTTIDKIKAADKVGTVANSDVMNQLYSTAQTFSNKPALGIKVVNAQAKQLNQALKAATASGKDYVEMQTSLIKANQALFADSIDMAAYSKLSSKAQSAIQRSIESDNIFRTNLNNIERITDKDFKRLETLSKRKGLTKAAKDVNVSVSRYNALTDKVKTTKIGTPAYIKRLTDVERARNTANKAIDNWDNIVHQQRYNLSPTVEARQTVSFIEQKLGYAQKELDMVDRLLQSRQLTPDEKQILTSLQAKRVMPNQYLSGEEQAQLNKLYDIYQSSNKLVSDADKALLQAQRRDLKGEVDYMQSLLDSVNDAISKGKPIPAEIRVKGYKLKQQLESFTAKPIEPEPSLSGTGKGGVAVAERTKVELQPSLLQGFELQPELGIVEKGLAEPKVKVPKIETEPKAKVAEPKVKVETEAKVKTTPAVEPEITPKGEPSVKGFAVPKTATGETIPETITDTRIKVGIQPMPVPSTGVTPSEFAQPSPSIFTTPTPTGITSPAVSPFEITRPVEYPSGKPATIAKGAEKTAQRSQVSPQTAGLIQTKAEAQAKAETKAQTATETKTMTELERATRTRIEESYFDPIKKIFVVPLPDGSGELRLNRKQWDSIIAWKMGIMYIMKWHPFRPKKDILYTRTPIEGVKYEDGIGSANRSLVAKGIVKEIPKQDMGIMKITFETHQGKAKPYMDFENKRSATAIRRAKAAKARRRNNDSYASLSGMW